MNDDPHVLLTLEAALVWITRELPLLMTSGDNWQITLHGGRNGDVIVETNRKAALVEKRKEQRPR